MRGNFKDNYKSLSSVLFNAREVNEDEMPSGIFLPCVSGFIAIGVLIYMLFIMS